MLQLSYRPLTASDADGNLFVDRVEELAAAERSLDLGLNVYVSGSGGSGKTSFLRRIEALRERTTVVNLARVEDIDGLIGRLAATINPSLDDFSVSLQLVRALRDQHRTQLESQGADRLGSLRSAVATQPSPPTMLLDNLHPQLVTEFFGRQRDELWEVPLQWLVVGDSPALDPPADTFFDTFLRLEPFGPDSIRELLVRRGRHGDPAQQQLMQRIANALPALLGSATPRQVISTARSVVRGADPEANLERLIEQQYSRHQLSARARLVLDALYSVGPAHAGNEQLLKQIGTTRSRVVQVLKELEEAQLVRSFHAGKRKLYEPCLGEGQSLEDSSGKPAQAPGLKAETRR